MMLATEFFIGDIFHDNFLSVDVRQRKKMTKNQNCYQDLKLVTNIFCLQYVLPTSMIPQMSTKT